MAPQSVVFYHHSRRKAPGSPCESVETLSVLSGNRIPPSAVGADKKQHGDVFIDRCSVQNIPKLLFSLSTIDTQ